jgi:menaquinone-dependent protoporphyrinogen oxidase
MEFLIIFETVEGQTRKIVERVEQQIRTAGHGVRTFDTEDRLAPLSFDDIDKVILAAPVHERRHPKSFEVLISANLDELKMLPTLLISVSLKAAFPESKEEAQDYLTEMKMRTGFSPGFEAVTAGAIRTGSYGYFESQVVEYVVLDGRDVDLVDGVREFTDWDKLSYEVAEFVNAKPLQVT